MVDDQADLEEARALLRAARRATVATIFSTTGTRERGGWPFASLVLIAHDRDGSPLLLLSDLAEHRRNIEADARVSLRIDGTAGPADPPAGPPLAVTDPRGRRAGARHPPG